MALYLPASELRLADVVLLENLESGYNTATVKQIKDGQITLFRPYVVTADFSYTGGVICYIGIEEITERPREGEMFTVLQRKELK